MLFRSLDDMCRATRPAEQCGVRSQITWSHTTSWATDPWTLGAYSAASPGRADQREALATPLENTLYFAGEATYNAEFNGSYAAAYNSALRTSGAIVRCAAAEEAHKSGQALADACEWQPIAGPLPGAK